MINSELPNLNIEEKIIKVNGDISSIFYSKGKELGKGGFAQVYELTNLETKFKFAAKIIKKSSLAEGRTLQKLMTEIKIHRSVHHKGIVKFNNFFEDSENIYILLELCNNGSLSEKLKRRRRLTELEAQNYLLQLHSIIKYLHSLKILHRDIKLSNLLLNEFMELKLGDFGLATKIEFEGERKRTICGTPNYIAPEVLSSKIGHSFEADIWSFGVVAYTLIIGKPPFESDDVKVMYMRIRTNLYAFPSNVPISSEARDLIEKILQTDPGNRLTLDQIAEHPFFNRNTIPKNLPLSTLCIPPSKNYLKKFEGFLDESKTRHDDVLSFRDEMCSLSLKTFTDHKELEQSPRNSLLHRLHICTSELKLESNIIHVTQWLDYSEKYGLGYKLSNGATGVSFNDQSQIIIYSNQKAHYYEKSHSPSLPNEFLFTNPPPELHKKLAILQQFTKHLKSKHPVLINPSPYVKKWFSNNIATIFQLSNKNTHIVFNDKIEILIQVPIKTIIFLEKNTQTTYMAKKILESGNEELIKRMRLAKNILSG
ncbi:hypothetical protein SteCoe_28237 [Stentor coeruleus]|uniref:Serine/threonine-protein kinase PLK n=1 Tax=Stentor coeruleus TaxID=5963 RepID=A0A1R2B8M9_9CILI|nr:hypothetical protein SteCoe_28237 [Stentor coeruleus]